MLKSQPARKAGPSIAASKAKGFKSIPDTADLLRRNEGQKRKGKGKERAVLDGLHDLMKATSNLPGAVQVERFAETRAMEIIAMQNAVKMAAYQNSTRSFQSLPRHLRRRAASHNPRRVPKRMREWAASEVDPSSTIARQQRKKAKLRAKRNLRGDSRSVLLQRRQRDKRWLGTHLYHVKRFHMFNIWGYRLPLTPTLKSFRASFRAARQKVTLHDASYISTIELLGNYDHLVAVLGLMTAGGSIAGEKYDNGDRVAKTFAYQAGAFPLGLIGPLEILWQRPTDGDSNRRLWLRVHPSIFDEVLRSAEESAQKLSQSSVKIRNIRNDLESFEIMGPLAGKVLRRVLRICRSEPEEKREAIESLLSQDPAECPDGIVCGFDVYDPRLSYPPQRIGADDDVQTTWDALRAISNEEAPSRLWDAGVRSKLRSPAFSKSDLDMRRHHLALPGSRLHALAKDDRIPVMLVKRTVPSGMQGEEAAAFHGYTLLFPRGWSMAFLPSFVYCNVRLGGIAERCVQYREAGTPSFPEHYGSVCLAGASWEEEQAVNAERRWLRKPPGKRPEYSLLGTKWPFRPDWNVVLSDAPDSGPADSAQAQMQPWLVNPALSSYIAAMDKEGLDVVDYLLRAVNAFRRRRSLEALPSRVAAELLSTAVCHVQVNMIGRGSPSDMAILYAVGGDERASWLQAFQVDSAGLDFGSDGGEMLKLGEAPNGSREIGFVNTGNISLTRGCGHALATVSLKGYLGLLAAANGAADMPGTAIVKVRNIDGHVCRLASLSVVG